MTVNEWKEDFKSYVEELQMPRDDYKGIMAYIDECPVKDTNPESRQMSLDEVLESDFVYLLLPIYEFTIPALVSCTVSWMDFVGFIISNSRESFSKQSYGKDWLCFTRKLTTKQCKEVKWDE